MAPAGAPDASMPIASSLLSSLAAHSPAEAAPPLHVIAGTALSVTVTALDAYGNPATSPVWWKSKPTPSILLEESATPKREDSCLSGGPFDLGGLVGVAGGVPVRGINYGGGGGGGGGGGVGVGVGGSAATAAVRQGADSTPLKLPVTNGKVKHTVTTTAKGELKNALTLSLKNGQATATVRATVAGWLQLSAAVKASGGGGGGSTSAYAAWNAGTGQVSVQAAPAEMFDLVPLDQSGPLGGMRLMVHARDAYGNLDETCEREVVVELDHFGPVALDHFVPDGGLVKLRGGVGELAGLHPKD